MMATPMSRLLEEVFRDHFAYPPATPEEIEEFERQVGWKLERTCEPSICIAMARS